MIINSKELASIEDKFEWRILEALALFAGSCNIKISLEELCVKFYDNDFHNAFKKCLYDFFDEFCIESDGADY